MRVRLVGLPVPVVVAPPRPAARPVHLDHHEAADHSEDAGHYVEGEACRDVPVGRCQLCHDRGAEYLSTVKQETKQRTVWTMAMMADHIAQHTTTAYSSCLPRRNL